MPVCVHVRSRYCKLWTRVFALAVSLAVPALASAQTIATVRLTAGVATFGQVAPPGVAPAGLKIGSLNTQVDVKNRWPDGSIRFAVLSAIVPSTANYAITAAAGATGTFERTWPSANVSFVITGGGPTGTFVATLPQATDADAWLSGPVVRENRVTVTPANGGTPHPFLRVIFDVRSYSNGQHKVDVAAQNVMHDAGNTLPYNVTVTVGGQQVFAKTGFKHFYLSRWRKDFPANGLVESEVTPDTGPFIAAKALPSYDPSIANTVDNPDASEQKPFFEIGQRGGLTQNGMPAAGGRAELGPYPDWVARYLVHKNSTVKQFMLRTDDLAGSWPIHVTDSQGRIIRTDRAPGNMSYWIDPRGGDGYMPKGNMQDPERHLYPEIAHCPSFAYVSYLLTGDRYYADELKYWANYGFIGTYPGNQYYPRKDTDRWPNSPGGPVTQLDSLILYGEIRALAWGLRNVIDAAAYTPDADPDQAYFRTVVAKNLERLDIEAARGGTQWLTPAPFDGIWVGKGQYSRAGDPTILYATPWQVGMTAWTIDHAIDQGLWGAHGTEYRRRAAAMLVRMFTSESEGLPKWAAGAPFLIYGEFKSPAEPYAVNWFTNMGQVLTKSVAATPQLHYPFTGWHGIEVYVTLNLAEGAGISGATTALDYLLGEKDADTVGMNDYLRTRAGWAFKRGSLGKGAVVPGGPRQTPIAPSGLKIIR